MQPQTILFDIDDTLFRQSDGYLPASVTTAFKALQQCGILSPSPPEAALPSCRNRCADRRHLKSA